MPEELSGTYSSVSDIQQAMTQKLGVSSSESGQTALYNVDLMVSTDGGQTWTKATEDNFPASGLNVTLPYPSGTGKITHEFKVAHMFTVTSGKLGTTAGDIETPEVTKADDGIHVTLKGLSPVEITWEEIKKSSGGGGSIPQTVSTEKPVSIPAETVEEPTKEELQVPASVYLNSGFLVSRKGNKVKVTWGAVPEADSYEIYANYCGNKSCVRVGTTTATSTTLKKLNGKKIKTKKFVKAYVIAFKNGVAIGRTILGHAAGPKSAYTNAKAVSVDQSAYQLKAGETAKVSATITKAKRNKKTSWHQPRCEASLREYE